MWLIIRTSFYETKSLRERTFVERDKHHWRERHLAIPYVNVVTYIKKPDR
jgi:hypothetical protein